MKITLLMTMLMLSAFGVNAQNVANEWMFGENCYVSFAGCKPEAKQGVPMVTGEGSVSMCDDDGKLLFYTNGKEIWNRDHQLMPNGKDLNGGVSSAQCAVSIAYPGNPGKYLLFTAADLTGAAKKGFHYSVINMNADAGRGDVEKKNIVILSDSTSEAVSATFDDTEQGFWIVTHHQRLDIFYSYHVTSSGVNPSPVISSLQNSTNNFAISQIKISPNGKMLALTNAFRGLVLYDFDNKTGRVSNLRSLLGGTVGAYGASFSPDNSKLYATYYNFDLSETVNSIAQFSVNLPNHAEIILSKRFLSRKGGYPYLGGMQLAPDGKIYVNEGEFLGVIERPNDDDSFYQTQAVYLNNRFAINGLPNYPDCLFASSKRQPCLEPVGGFTAEAVCEGSAMQYTDTSLRAEEWSWEFPGGEPGTFEGQFPPPVIYKNAGFYTTKLTTKNEYGEHVLQQSVTVWDVPEVHIEKPKEGPGASLCRGDQVQLQANATGNVRFQWGTDKPGLSDYSIANPVARPNVTTTYHLQVFSNPGNCIAEDSITIVVRESEVISARIFTDMGVADLSRPVGLSVKLSSNGVGSGIFSFKGKVKFDKTVFQYRPGSISAKQGFNNTWDLKANETERGTMLLEGYGSTAVFDALLKMEIDAYMGKQETGTVLLTIDSINGRSVTEPPECVIFDITSENEKPLLLGEVCGGSMRYVNILQNEYSLDAVTPNPVENESRLEFSIAIDGNVNLEVFGPAGNVVKTLANGFYKAGKYSIQLLAKDFPSGVYRYRLSAGQYSETRSFVVVR